jgi:hypothetical protein
MEDSSGMVLALVIGTFILASFIVSMWEEAMEDKEDDK